MGIFKRKRGQEEPPVRGADPEADIEPSADLAEAELDADPDSPGTDGEDEEADEPLDEQDIESEPGAADEAPHEPALDRADGPYDLDEVEPDGTRLDLGALQVPAIPGMQVSLEVDEAAQTVNAVQIALDGSFVQMQAFAAPRTLGVWPDIRTEIAQSITAQGGSADVVDGPLGRELTATMPKNGPAMRFLGVDGPRWFLRAVISGRAATDEQAAVRLVEAVRGTVVVRGDEAMAPRELLPLRMPAQPSPEPAPGQPAAQPSAEDLKPFERGPEITEVR